MHSTTENCANKVPDIRKWCCAGTKNAKLFSWECVSALTEIVSGKSLKFIPKGFNSMYVLGVLMKPTAQ